MMARSSLMGCTLTETVRMLEPIGIDRWPIDLSHKYGMRDALTCSVRAALARVLLVKQITP